jgi:hypothetical protein
MLIYSFLWKLIPFILNANTKKISGNKGKKAFNITGFTIRENSLTALCPDICIDSTLESIYSAGIIFDLRLDFSITD